MATALIIDYDPVLLDLMQTILQRAGYETWGTHVSEEALDLVYLCRPDLVVLNDTMPHVSGVEICARIKANPELASTLVIVVSAGQQVRDPAYVRRIGADAAQPKPFLPADFMRTVERVTAGA